MREQSEFLNDVADPAPQRDGIDLGDVLSIDRDRAGGGVEEAIDQPQGGGFAGAAGAEQDERFAALDGEADVVQNRMGADRIAHMLEGKMRQLLSGWQTWDNYGLVGSA